ncbi:MAG: hypothetical protein F2693_07595 [Actinobacteria bacterium]|nr:hypothetical protein [Actinomycetota bacterium]
MSAQGGAQILSAAVGIIAVRSMPVQEFVLYTLIVSLAASIFVAANSGFVASLFGIGGRLDGRDAARFIRSLISWQRKNCVIAAILSAPITAAIAWSTLGSLSAVAISLVLTPLLVLANASANSASQVCIMKADRAAIYRGLYFTSLTRVVLASCLAVGKVGFAAIFVLVNVTGFMASRATQNGVLRKLVGNSNDVWSDSQRREVSQKQRKLLPSSLYLGFQSQIGVVTLGLAGAAGAVADLGALNRFAIAYAVVISAVSVTVMPLIARAEQHEVGRLFVLVALAVIAIATSFLLVTLLWPEIFLLMLGSQYSHLREVLPTWSVAFGLMTLAESLASCNAARGHVRSAWLEVPISLGVIVSSTLWLNYDNVIDPLHLMIALMSVRLAVQLLVYAAELRTAKH